MYDLFLKTAREIFEEAGAQGRLHYNPDYATLKKWFAEEPGVRPTRYGSLEVDTEPTSRLARFTRNNIDDQFGPEEAAFLARARRLMAGEELIAFDVTVGDGSEGVSARMVVPKRHAHVCYGGTKLFKPAAAADPTYWVLFFMDEEFERNKARKQPDKKVMLRNAHSADGRMVKFVNNSNYIGEWKKGIFAGEDYRAKIGGKAIFLHAGCRMDCLENVHGDFKVTSSLFAALSANGKTSLTCKVLAKKGKEKSWLIQDDGGTLRMDGSFRGFEGGGVFVKTERLNPHDQIETYYGALRPDTYLENVSVDAGGEIDFYNLERTSNGRAVIERRDFMHSSPEINVERVDHLFLITRGDIIPAVSKLTPEQAAAFMILGQSMESSAGDPTRAGQLKNEFFYDPFIAGNKTAHANLFYEVLTANPHIQCFLINTGGVGEGEEYRDISLNDTMGILDSLVRGGLEDWETSPGTGLLVPRAVRTVDDILMHPKKLYGASEFEERQGKLDEHRARILERFPGLNRKVAAVF